MTANKEGKTMRRIKFTRWGLGEDPRGQHVRWTIKDRIYSVEVTGIYRNETTGHIMLKTKHFCGDPGPDVAAATVEVVAER